MSSYEISMAIPSCNVNKTLLKELEEYIKKKGIEVLGEKHDTEKSYYHFNIEDKYGEESLSTIDEYSRERFQNDIKGISLSFSDWPTRISISFGLDKLDSQIRISIESPNAREVSQGIINEILNRLKDYKNLNYLFPSYVPWLNSGFLIIASVLFIDAIYRNIFKDAEIRLYAVISGLVMFTILIYNILTRFNPYCVFDTNRNKEIGKNTSLIIKGAAGLLFGLFLTLLFIN